MIEVELPDGVIAEFPDGTDKAVIKAALQKRFAPRETYDPTAGMSSGEQFAAAYGGVLPKMARGVAQTATEVAREAQRLPRAAQGIPFVGPALGAIRDVANLAGVDDQMIAEQRAATDEARRLDAPLMETGAGKAGNVAGSVALAVPSAFVPGANTYLGSAILGGLYGLVEPVGAEDSRTRNTAIGGASGLLSQAAGRALGSMYQGIKSYFAPLTQKGQEKIVAAALRRFAENPDAIARGAAYQSAVPGVQPTLAEATLDPGIAGLQLATKNADPVAKSQLVRQELNNNAARLLALGDIAKTPADRAAAVTARKAASDPLYTAADEIVAPADATLKKLLNRPSLEKAWSRAAQLAEERGQQLVIGKDIPAAIAETGIVDSAGRPITREVAEQSASYTGKGLHYLKMALDDLIDSPQTSGIGKNELSAIQGTKRELLDWMDNAIEPYGAARKTFAEMSAPINQMDVGRELYEKLVPALSETAEVPTRITASQYANALRNAEQTAKRATGMDMPLERIMTPDQMGTLQSIAKDLGRKAGADDLAKTVGSTTAQNLAAENLLRQTLGPLGVPKGWLEGEVLPNMAKALLSPYKLMNTDQAINQRLAKALMNPQEAAALVSRLPPGDQGRMLQLLTRGAVPAGILSRDALQE
jgi:hypothetical protein